MASSLGSFFRERRIERRLSLGQLARLVGYKSITGACNKIQRFEQSGVVHDHLLSKLRSVLDIEVATVEMLVEKDRQRLFAEWLDYVNKITPYVVLRVIPAVYVRCPLPDEICGVEEAEEYASQLSRLKHKRCCLVLSRYSVWFDEQGKVECRTEAVPGEPNAPYMRTRRGRPFLLRTVSNQQIVEAVRWPTK